VIFANFWYVYMCIMIKRVLSVFFWYFFGENKSGLLNVLGIAGLWQWYMLTRTRCDKHERCRSLFVITGMGRENGLMLTTQNSHSFSMYGIFLGKNTTVSMCLEHVWTKTTVLHVWNGQSPGEC
jgi:hypothetical protein